MITIIKILRLPVVLPIAVVLIATLPIWECIAWLFQESILTWQEIAQHMIKGIAKFVWP